MANRRRRNIVKSRLSAVAPPRIVPPAALDVDEQKIWDELIREASWLTKFDRFNLHIFACAQAKYNRDPKSASNALVSRIRSMGTKLRLDDPPNKRKSHHMLFTPERTERTEADRFFDDDPVPDPESPEAYRARKAREDFDFDDGDE